MKAYIGIVVVIVSSCLSCQRVESNKEAFEIASERFLEVARVLNEMSYYKRDTLSLEIVRKHTHLDTVLAAPLSKVAFLVFRYSGIEPSPVVVLAHSNGTIELLEAGKPDVIDQSVVQMVNVLLTEERKLNVEEVVQLAKLILVISDYGREALVILESAKGILEDDNHRMPDSIKTIVQEPTTQVNGSSTMVQVYCWNKFTGNLFRAKIAYSNKHIVVEVDTLGQYGVAQLRL